MKGCVMLQSRLLARGTKERKSERKDGERKGGEKERKRSRPIIVLRTNKDARYIQLFIDNSIR